MPRHSVLLAVVLYAAFTAYNYSPIGYRPHGPLAFAYILLVAGLLVLIGYVAASYVIFALPVGQTLIFALMHNGEGAQAGFVLLVTVVLVLPLALGLLWVGVALARDAAP